MDGALIVNPYDVQGVADALQTALNMSLDERKSRWTTLVKPVRQNDVVRWRESFLDRLRSVTTRSSGSSREDGRVRASR
jgi:trehalose 6-phosphate synthase